MASIKLARPLPMQFGRRALLRAGGEEMTMARLEATAFPCSRTVLVCVALSVGACAIIPPGERGVRRTLGQLDDEVLSPGPAFFNPFLTTVVTVPVRTMNLEVRLPLPSKEGLTIQSEISILYRVNPLFVPKILEEVGPDYERVLILSIFRSAAATVSARHFAKDMHSGRRGEIEREISLLMNEALHPRGFEVEAVLMKSILLPERLTQAIELKLQSEQEALRMEFVLARERLEAQRRLTEAKGLRDAQQVLAEGLTPLVIQFRALEVFGALAASSNTKIIFTDGRSPLLLPPELGAAGASPPSKPAAPRSDAGS